MIDRTSSDLARDAGTLLAQLRGARPMIHHITNDVVTNDTANVTLHVGAAPVMTAAPEEVAEMVGFAGALVLNIGTLTRAQIEAMLLAGRRANERGIPVVLDPVGVGATAFRTEMAERLLAAVDMAVIRGNAGEIGVLAGAGGQVRGVDSVSGGTDPVAAAAGLARRHGTIVAMTGVRDIVTDGARTLAVGNGHALLAEITGTGCMATTVVACFLAVSAERLLATAAALAAFGLAGEQAAAVAEGPGSFKVALFDALARLGEDGLARGARMEVVQDGPPLSSG